MMKRPNLPYSMMINWSDTNGCFIVSIPEFGRSATTHGETWEEAVAMGKDLMESCIMWAKNDGNPLPEPLQFDDRTGYAPNPFEKVCGLKREVEEAGRWRDEHPHDEQATEANPSKEAASV